MMEQPLSLVSQRRQKIPESLRRSQGREMFGTEEEETAGEAVKFRASAAKKCSFRRLLMAPGSLQTMCLWSF